jgi:AraC-like DNA-binding protein
MRDSIFFPSAILKPYVMYYWTCRHDEDTSEIMYPSGCVEFCIDISGGNTIRHRGDQSMKVPNLELLGHWNIPTTASVAKGNVCLITRFHPFASSLFFPNPASDLTNRSIDLRDIVNNESRAFYDRVMENRSLEEKIKILEDFLIQRMLKNNRNVSQLNLVESLCKFINCEMGTFNIQKISQHFGFSERYIQKLFLSWVGITPQSFFSVQRFNKSLVLLKSSKAQSTSIALECGYYDQAHFIKEFRGYTGLTPLKARTELVREIEIF